MPADPQRPAGFVSKLPSCARLYNHLDMRSVGSESEAYLLLWCVCSLPLCQDPLGLSAKKEQSPLTSLRDMINGRQCTESADMNMSWL